MLRVPGPAVLRVAMRANAPARFVSALGLSARLFRFGDGHKRLHASSLCLAVVLLSTPASGQAVTFADLDGHMIQARITREQTNQRDGKTFTVTVHQNWRVSIGPANKIEFSVRSIVQGPRRVRDTGPLSGSYTLDESREVGTQGGGDAAWTFADGALAFIRTYPAGARRLSFAFARGPDGLTCTATFAFAREDGSGPVRLKSRFSRRDAEILDARQASSTCRVTRTSEPPSAERGRP